MYNMELKERFLNSLKDEMSDSTLYNIRYILNKAKKTEEALNKDVYEMNADECKSVINSYSNRSEQVVRVNISVLQKYVDFCISEGYVPSRINYFEILSASAPNFVNVEHINNKYITREELNDIQDEYIVNAQDKALFELMFIGVMGDRFEELINLKESDIHYNKIVLPNRVVEITPRTHQILIEAANQNIYIKAEGGVGGNHIKLKDNDYVLKPTVRSEHDLIPYGTLRTRINKIRTDIGNKNITPKSVCESGMLDLAKKIYAEKGELNKEDWVEVCKKYNKSNNLWFPTKKRLEGFI